MENLVYRVATCILAVSCNVLNPAYATDLNPCPQPQLFQLASRFINYHWMHGGILAPQLTEWLAATISCHA